jgi:hypothetical protein
MNKEQIKIIAKFITVFGPVQTGEVAGQYFQTLFGWNTVTTWENIDIVSSILDIERYQIINN